MKTLFILRHAKSSWDDPGLSDFERPLNDRGRRVAPFMGELMKRKGIDPAIIISSPAERAKTTAELVKDAADSSAEIRYDERIYEASPQALRQVVSELDDSYGTAMIVGHNPGIEGFIRFLTGQLEPMPTASLAVISLSTDTWEQIDEGSGKLEAISRPKDEMKAYKG
jgi:phosphohistidine phosphatase